MYLYLCVRYSVCKPLASLCVHMLGVLRLWRTSVYIVVMATIMVTSFIVSSNSL